MKIIGWVCLLWLSAISSVNAVPIQQNEIPPALQEWVPWVLHDEQEQLCPFAYQQFDKKRCRWPVKTSLDVTNSGGSFTQQWTIATSQWVPLVGRNDQWPEQVRVDGRIQAVIRQGNKPHVYLSAGEYFVSGEFSWSKLPKTIALPADNALLTLTVNGQIQAFPKIDKKGQLWLQKNTVSNQKPENDSLTITVHRHLNDAIPFEVTTQIELNISGSEREIQLSGALLDGFIAKQLTSPLPARMEADGLLRVQAKAGQWGLSLTSRAPVQVNQLQLSQAVAPWPEQEVWVFQSQPNFRQVNVSGAVAIDPKNTRLPQQWQHWPAYQIDSTTVLAFEQKQRGDATQQQDQLNLKRTWWLDFDGQGFSLQDHITGQVHGRYRLPMNAAIQLGRVAVNGEDQFITKLADDDKQGVELRLGNIDVVADSQWQGGFTLPATGWDADFQNVSAELNMPPGWRLLAVSGVDKSSGSWLSRWTLLDLFLVFIIAASFSHLWGKAWGGVALVSMVVLYHEQGAPVAVWLNVLAASALLKVLPTGKFKVWIQRYFFLSVAAVVLISLPFMVQQARQGIYPQLEYPTYKVAPASINKNRQLEEADYEREERQEKAMSAMMMDEVASYAELASPAPTGPSSYKRALATYDPNTKVQTGPGLPSWQWRNSHLSFSGPVAKDQMIDLWLLSPLENRLLAFARIALLLALIACVLGWRKGIDLKSMLPMLATVILMTTALPQPAMADMTVPDESVLQQLKQRLLSAPDCVPECAASSAMQVKLESDQLVIWQTIDVAHDVLVPLPGQRDHWTPQFVSVDGLEAAALHHDKQGRLWILLAEGQHEILLTGLVPQQVVVQLMLPMKPHHLSTITGADWLIEGNLRSGHVSDLLLKRQDSSQQVAEKTVLTPTSLPAFVKVERRFDFNQQWTLETRVTRLTPADSVVRLKIPLIDGEQVLREGLEVSNNEMQVQLRQGQQHFQWRSVLTQTDILVLQAKETDEWVEYWNLSWGPIWHVQWKGLPLINSGQAGSVLWRPWPGEQLSLAVQRPAGEQGQTLTLDQSVLKVRPGQRSSDIELNLSLRSSLGQQQIITLPEGSQLTQVTLQGKKLPLQLVENELTLPINPGAQQAVIKWRQPSAVEAVLQTPFVLLGLNGVNHEIELFMPKDRWILAVGGPQLGPAVLMWGVLLVLVLVAIALGRVPITPLKAQHWVLLFLGLTQASMLTLAIVVGWLMALGLREKRAWTESRMGFNFVQIGLGFLTLVALSSLFFAIEQGLLGQPDMQIVGNGSYRQYLHWYQDHSGEVLPQAWVVSVPLFIYRALMLLWSLWLAFALLGWLRWGWQCFSRDGIWRQVKLDLSSKSWGNIKKNTEEKDES
ncbi:hypothetical protein A9Q79_05120 [Methylophaga sp. 42_25_T18]|nr:hypothetical protein A9Q79_05120 [Methylophaga sp. 42_25_T18]OUR85825.1 hypothetical protein A9Q92_07295 [Methylophaga sp. 42_8_T64]